MPLLCFAVAGVAAAVAVVASRRGGSRKPAAGLALIASLAAILSLTLAPMNEAAHDFRLVPLSDILDAFRPSLDTSLVLEDALNVLLFVPFGASLGLRRLSLGTTALAAVALSAAVELAQALFVSGRTTSVDDLLLNTLGAALGHLLVSGLVRNRG